MFTAIIIKSIIIWKHEEGRGHGHLPPLLVLKLSPDALFVNYCLSHLAVDRIKWLNVVKDTLGNVSVQFSSVQSFSNVRLFVTPWTTAHQDSLSITDSWSLLKLFSIESVMPSNHLILCCPLLLLPSVSQHQRLFQWVSSSHQVVKVLEFQFQHQSFQWIFRSDFLKDGLVGSPCSPRASQESSPTPQVKSISSLALSFLYSPTLTSIHDHWKTIASIRQTLLAK